MSIRGISPIIGIQAKPKLSLQPRPPKSIRTHSEKKFTPQINKSFTCYHDVPNQSNQSFSADKARNISLAHMQSRNTSIGKYRNYRSIQKLTSKDPQKKEITAILLERAQDEMKENNFKSAINYLNKVIKEEASNPSALYYRGKCYISLKSYKEAIPDLLSLVQEYPMYEKNAYVALAMSFVAINDYTTAIRQLTKAVTKFPKFNEAYLARGQLLAHQKIWDKAIGDFYKVISQVPEDANAYIGLADALSAMGDQQTALKVLNSAGNCPNISSQACLRKGKLFYELNSFKKALKELNKAIKITPSDPESYYYKALVQLNQNNLPEAALCLEQVVKYDIEKQFIGAAIYDLGAIKIKQKDYYGAMHTFQRATDKNVEIKQQKILVNYVEAILTLMKRKFKEGTVLLTKIIKNNNPLMQEYIGNCFSFRGYAYAAQEMHEKAGKDLAVAAKIQKLDSASEYNFLVSSGILAIEKKPEQALAYLEKAKDLYVKNPEPYVYEAYSHFVHKLYDKSKSLLSQAIELKPEDSNLHFFRGIISYAEGKYSESMQDLDVAIDKAEDNHAYHYLCRGLSYAQLGLYSEAINDFSCVLQIDEHMEQAYFYRGHCGFLQEDTNLAYADFQKLLHENPESPEVHIHAGDLLMLTQCTEDAIKAYNNSISKAKNKTAYVQKAKCYMILGQLDSALNELSEALAVKSEEKLVQDYTVLKACESAQQGNFAEALEALESLSSDGEIITLKEIKKLVAVFFFYLSEHSSAQEIFQLLLETEDSDSSEIILNLALNNIISEFYEAALTQLNELAYMVEGIDRGKIILLAGIVELGLGNEQQGKAMIADAYKYDPISVAQVLKQSSQNAILPLNCQNEFAVSFPLISTKIGNSAPISLRPSFKLPSVEMPRISFAGNENVLKEFNLQNIKCKPEAPWLNRVHGMIQFTDEVQDVMSETVTESVADEKEEHEDIDENEDVFDEGTENFKKYRSALCLPREGSEQILKNMQAVLHNNNEEGGVVF